MSRVYRIKETMARSAGVVSVCMGRQTGQNATVRVRRLLRSMSDSYLLYRIPTLDSYTLTWTQDSYLLNLTQLTDSYLVHRTIDIIHDRTPSYLAYRTPSYLVYRTPT